MKPSEFKLKITGNYLQKNALAVLYLIVSNNWERPVYFNFTSLNTLGLDVRSYAVDEGLIYRLTQVENQEGDIRVDTEQAHKNLVMSGDFSNLARSDVFFNYEDYHLRMITPLRQTFNTLAAAFLEEGDSTKAKSVLTKSFANLFHPHLLPAYADVYTADLLHALREDDKAKIIALAYVQKNLPEIERRLQNKKVPDRAGLYFFNHACELLEQLGEPQYAQHLKDVSR
jgi:hypothetical protein